MKSIGQAWNKFFFEPMSPATLGLFRIAFGVVCFLSILGKFPYREIFYGADAIVSLATMDLYFKGKDEWLYFRFLPQSEVGLTIFFSVFLASIVSLTVGFFSRTSSVLVFLGMILLSNRNFFVDNHGDDLMRINCFFLMFAPSGASYSVDRWLLRRRSLSIPPLDPMIPWAFRILQLQLSYVYIEAAITKLPGQTWQDGTAIYYALNYLEHRRFDFRWMFSELWQVKFATFSTMIAELAAGTAIWWHRLRYFMLAAALGLHLGINLMMQFPVFQYVMMASLLLFIYPADVERAVNWIRSRAQAK